MPQHKSAEKRVRQNAKRRLRNRMHKSKLRTLIKKVRTASDAASASVFLNETKAYLDRLACKRVIAKNMSANTKSKLEHYVNSLT